MHPVTKANRLADTLRNQVCEVELVSRLSLADGTTQEITNVRRAVCKKAMRRGNKTILTFADIDRSTLDRIFPFEMFTVADFPEIYIDHVGRRIPQGVGTARKVPLTWIVKTGGAWRYAGPKVIGAPGAVLAVYRGNQVGQGAVVDPSEYTVSTAVGASSGVSVVTVNFVKEQLDGNGRPYVIEADFSLPGSRLPSDEVKRILEAYGLSADAATFAAAAAYDTGAGFAVDSLYGGKGRTGNAILGDLLEVARAWLTLTAAGPWALVQDRPKASIAGFDSQADQIEVEEYGDGDDRGKTVSIDYRPRSSLDQDYRGHLPPDEEGDKRIANPYVYEHGVADRLRCYWQKRLDTLRRAIAGIHAVQLPNGEVISLAEAVAWSGTKDFIMTGVRRPADRNQVILRERDEGIYVYTAGTLPADATNGYAPDYSFTDPAAPAAPAIVSQGTSSDTDGKTTAHALIRAVPPTVNWAELWTLVIDTTTQEERRVPLGLNGANYEARIPGLRPNRAHTAQAYAINANGRPGFLSPATNFTSANATTALAAPTVTVTQVQSKEVKVELGAVANVAGQPNWLNNILFEKVGAGAFAEVKRDKSRTFIRTVVHGTTYAYKARSEDMNHNESADSSEASITPAAKLDDGYIIGQGVSGASIANSSINRGRSDTGTGSASGSIGAGSGVAVTMDTYTFFPNFTDTSGVSWLDLNASLGASGDTGAVGIHNTSGGGASYSLAWRKFNA